MKKFFENFTDKKFLMSLIAVITGILALFNIGDSTINLITSLVLIILPVIGYIVSEGIIDWTQINTAITQILQIIGDYLKEENNGEENEQEVEVPSGTVKKLNNTKEKEIILEIAKILEGIRK